MMGEKIATREAYGEALAELGNSNEAIVVMDADLSCSTKTNVFAKKFPKRFYNIGVAEQNMMGWAAGLSVTGKIPFVSTFAIFATARAYDQIRNGIAAPKMNVKICASHAGLSVGPDGASHQAIEDIALMRILPNMTVVVPADGPQARAATNAIAHCQGPVYLRLGRPKVETITTSAAFEIGRAQTLLEGNDLTLIACGTMVPEAMKAARQLKASGIEARVINMHTIKPIDQTAILTAARETGAIITAEEHTIIGGLGSAVAEVLAEAGHPCKFSRIGVKDVFGESGEPEQLFKKFGIDAETIITRAQQLIR